ncbi:uncharacterized protein P174DRAFT_504901 [Aspergillus novofumigatus IBT 16806]|uniref:Uncharacterized protein n=1 Tax=Aspergillus novofumigatus (strain IBT 16806) TaxID=1392255 RepID=A0A2I1C5D7_ASPN1|nr:uncharacterized protein P174DRAFT_504901 [Aspergillus novofumigatus IBT 16806]PKX92805.1 hypothetical protein P174DRAFT_504901 [Aspergillus novofumigatus IBT 16806]
MARKPRGDCLPNRFPRINDAQHVHNGSADNKDNGNKFLIEQQTQQKTSNQVENHINSNGFFSDKLDNNRVKPLPGKVVEEKDAMQGLQYDDTDSNAVRQASIRFRLGFGQFWHLADTFRKKIQDLFDLKTLNSETDATWLRGSRFFLETPAQASERASETFMSSAVQKRRIVMSFKRSEVAS